MRESTESAITISGLGEKNLFGKKHENSPNNMNKTIAEVSFNLEASQDLRTSQQFKISSSLYTGDRT